MLIANIKWSPVRLKIERLDTRRYVLTRGDRIKGKVIRDEGRWKAMHAYVNKETGHVSFDHHVYKPSFVTAALHLCRHTGLYVSDGGAHPPYAVMAQRIGIAGVWFTVITSITGSQHPTIYLDHPKELEKPTDFMQAILCKVVQQIQPPSVKGILRGSSR